MRRRSALAYVASPLGRARRTMELARAALGLPPQAYATDARLMELSFGSWEGLTWPEVQARAPEAAVARETSKWDFAPPDGESYAMLALRIAPWLDELDGDTLVVSHGGVARVLLALIGGVAHERAAVSNLAGPPPRLRVRRLCLAVRSGRPRQRIARGGRGPPGPQNRCV